MSKAVFPGSFDPITSGHLDIVKRAIPLFEEIVVAIGQNSSKSYLFSVEQRKSWLTEVFADYPSVSIGYYEGLTAEYCREIDAKFMIRGLRNASDFDYEKTISQLNHIIGKDLETIFFIARPSYAHISSTIVREIIKGGGDVSLLVPPNVKIDNQQKS
ncbi:MAG: pantetheine-phosphate adenylyltransferase [Saprospiraceae bacterium]|nr:pantetheine-phosphate adenylyltransferase [Saprospiraceae bacterium]